MRKLRLCLTGQTGILGTSLLDACQSQEIACIGLNRDEYISSNEEVISNFLIDKKINTFIHCAANTDVEYCEKNIESCYRDNFLLCVKLQLICEKLKIKFVFMSSTGVYGDYKTTPYSELDDAYPTTHHHMAKLHAEKSIMAISQKTLIVRTGWLFGGNWYSQKNFVANRVREAASSKRVLFANNTQRGSPTYACDLAKTVLQLIEKDIGGIINCVNQGFATRYDYVKEIVEHCKLPIEVKPLDSSNFVRVAKVSNNEMALNQRMKELKIQLQPNWRKSLGIYLDHQLDHWKTK